MSVHQEAHSEIWKQIHRIEIKSRRLVDQLLNGQYQSVFKGVGLEFEEVRPYMEGDDERHIDWNVTARTGQLHIKRFIEERELSLFLLVDSSASVFWGSSQRLKMDLALEFAAVMAFSALRNNDRVGLLTIVSEVRTLLPPRKGRRHALRVVREMLACFDQPPPQGKSNLDGALQTVSHLLNRRGIIFVISDFMDTGSLFRLSVLNRRHDCVAVRLLDPLDFELPDIGWVRLQDPETGQQQLMNLGSAKVRQQYAEKALAREEALNESLKRMSVDQISLRTDSDSIWKEMLRFYQRHRK